MVTRLVCLASILTCCSVTFAEAKPPADDLKVAGPFTSGNLTVYVVRRADLPTAKKYLTLAEALKQKKIIVREIQQVNQLTVENVSDEDVYLQAGEIVKGGQQDRTLSTDLIVSARSKEIPITANCVEHGRWTQRGSENQALFSSSANALASKDMKAANYAKDQSAVWEGVTKAQGKIAKNAGADGQSLSLNSSPTSLELTVEDKAVTAATDVYQKQLEKQSTAYPDAVGFMFAVNGKLNSGDVYATSAMFEKMYPKLLHAAEVEAYAEREKQGDKKYNALSATEVEAMLEAVDAAKPETMAKAMAKATSFGNINQAVQAQAAQVPVEVNAAGQPDDRTKTSKRDTTAIDVYESRDAKGEAAYLHRAYLTK